MAYFSNGSEGMGYEEHYCMRCMHRGPEEGPGCPVWFLHLQWNYDACNGQEPEAEPIEKVKYVALNSLIPRSADGCHNEQCTMFAAKSGVVDAPRKEGSL